MRVAQMVERNLIEDAIGRAIDSGSRNVGCAALIKMAERLKAALSGG